jgi:hypothetical protein
MIRPDCRALSAIFAMAGVLVAPPSRADIPADYAGTPYLGKPSIIPGRVELTNVDLGGEGVAYHADHRRSNSAGYEPISGNDYRPDDKDLPNICKTNGVNPDVWADDGTTYPSEADKYSYYIGYAHAVDWVKVTVDVKAAGKYYVSSYWASEGDKWGLSIWFNDGKGPVDAARPKDGVNKTGIIEMDGTSDYHKWKKYPNFATVDLSAGLQVMTFHLEKHDHLQYGFLQFDPVDGVTGLGGAGAGGAAGAGGSGGGAGGSPTGGVGGSDASGGSAPTSAGGTSSGTSAGGSAPTSAGAPSSGGTPTQTPVGNQPQANDSSGCSMSRANAGASATALLLLAGYALSRRRLMRL